MLDPSAHINAGECPVDPDDLSTDEWPVVDAGHVELPEPYADLSPYPALPADARTRDVDDGTACTSARSPWPLALMVAVVLVCGFALACRLVTEGR